MSSFNSAAAAQVIATYQGMATNNTVNNVILMLLMYDVLLTSGQECQYIWRSPKSWFSRALYVWNRYLALLYNLLSLGTISSISDISCVSLGWLISILQILAFIGPAIFTTLRIYALERENRIAGGVALVLSMVPFVINVSTVYQRPPINLPAPINCTATDTASRSLQIGLVIASRGSLILVDSLAAAVTWRRTRAAIQLRTGTTKRPSLEQVMWENGAVYFCVLVSINVVNLVLVLLSIALPPLGEQSSYVSYFVDPMSSILNSRFLLALHETNARMDGTDTSIVSSLYFNTGSDVDPKATSPELPEFLGVLGGPTHLSHDDDDDLGSLELASPQEEGPQSEPEGENQENRGDGGYSMT